VFKDGLWDIVNMAKRDADKKTEFLSVRVPAHTKTALLELAEENERSVSWIVAKILDKHLKSSDAGDLSVRT